MTSRESGDPLVALWQSGSKPDVRELLEDLEGWNRLHRRSNRAVLAILCGMCVLLAFEEFTGRLATHGALSVIWTVGLGIGVVWRRRARCKRLDALTLDTASLLRVMIARAASDLAVARCLYAGVPGGALAGWWAMRFLGGAAPASAVAFGHSAVPMGAIQMGAGIAALIGMVATGAILARSRRGEVRRLKEMLHFLQADL